MSREAAVAHALDYFDGGGFVTDLARRVAIPSTAQDAEHRPDLDAYLADEIGPTLRRLGYEVAIFENPVPDGGPFLVAERHEDDEAPTVLTYGHGDVVRGQEGSWRSGLDPWCLVRDGDRLYGRGTADNKGQHTINIAALASVLATRGRLGFNSLILLETSEEIGSPGLREFCTAHRERLRADVLIGSDGPRLVPTEPTLFLGTRGALDFELAVELRDGGHHSGNWGGLLANPGIRLAHAISTLVGPTGRILVAALRPAEVPASVRDALAGCRIDGGDDGPAIDVDWGEPGLTPPERVFAWNTLEVLAFTTGNPDRPVNAIPPRATAWCQIRFTVDRDPATFLPAIRHHLDEHGFGDVEVRPSASTVMNATRLLPDHPWVRFVSDSVESTVGRAPMIVPSVGGSLPNDVFAHVLGLPTVWVPHSYGSCSQHAPDEHLLASVARQGLAIMTGVFWDVGAGATPPRR